MIAACYGRTRWHSGSIEWSQVRMPLRPLGNFGNFLYPTLPVSFGRVKYPTQGVNVKLVVDSISYLVNNVYMALSKNNVKAYVILP